MITITIPQVLLNHQLEDSYELREWAITGLLKNTKPDPIKEHVIGLVRMNWHLRISAIKSIREYTKNRIDIVMHLINAFPAADINTNDYECCNCMSLSNSRNLVDYIREYILKS